MGDILLTVIALMLCCLLLWLRVRATAHSVRFRAFRGTVHAPGGIGAFASDLVTGALVARVKRFALRGADFELGDLTAHHIALSVAAGHTLTAVYAERSAKSPRPALLFNHDTTRWRVVPGAWVSLRGDAASHFLPTLVLFVLTCAAWIGAASGSAPSTDDLFLIGGVDPVVTAFACITLALAAFAALAVFALRSLDAELERRAVQALRNALFALSEDDRGRRALFNLAVPRTRRGPQTSDLIAI